MPSELERFAIQDLRTWGCKCKEPLLGWRPEWGPRCRLCNTENPNRAWKAEAMEVLRRHRGNTVPVMKALMATGSRADLILADDVHRADDAARRLIEKGDGRHG